jgi:hypothetical protein
MKELIAISTLAMLLTAGCASHETNRGGASDTTGTSADYNTGAVHPGTTLGTNPSEDADTNSPPRNEPSGTETSPSGANPPPSTAPEPDSGSSANPGSGASDTAPGTAETPDENTPSEGNPDDASPGIQPPDSGPGNNGANSNGPTEFNLHRTILMISI